MPLIPAAVMVLVLLALAGIALATRGAEARTGGHQSVALNLRAYSV